MRFFKIKFGLGRKSQVRTCMPNFIILALKCGPTASKIAKNRNFWYNKGKFRGPQKVEYRYTTTNLPLCNDTIIVLKITLLRSVSVIKNFVIPKRDKKTNKKHHTFSSTADARSTIPTILGTVIEEVRALFAPALTYFAPISSFAARGNYSRSGL